MLTKFSKDTLEADDSSLSDNPSHRRDSYGNECWLDANDNIIHTKDAVGAEWWYEYDAKGNTIHEKHSGGSEPCYDNNGYEVVRESV